MRLLTTLLLFVASAATAQQQIQWTPEQKDAIDILLRESAQERERARVAELAMAKAQRELAEASKQAAQCTPTKPDKK